MTHRTVDPTSHSSPAAGSESCGPWGAIAEFTAPGEERCALTYMGRPICTRDSSEYELVRLAAEKLNSGNMENLWGELEGTVRSQGRDKAQMKTGRAAFPLRDWFAGQMASAIAGARIRGLGWKAVGSEHDWVTSPQLIAEAAYKVADAMLKEREKQP